MVASMAVESVNRKLRRENDIAPKFNAFLSVHLMRKRDGFEQKRFGLALISILLKPEPVAGSKA